MKGENLFFYSVNTLLAYEINMNFYNNVHFVWCSPVFDPTQLERGNMLKNIPTSSNPCKIYLSLFDEVNSHAQDYHGAKIKENKSGLLRGAAFHFEKQSITEYEFSLITKIVEKAPLSKFTPLLYIIPKELVKTKVSLVNVEDAANPLSIEYRIVDLNRNEFDFIEIPFKLS